MIDFTKKIKNSNKFRQSAIKFIATGSYCQFPIGTTEYFQFWDTELDRCINGYTADDGDYITGYNYFYINYCPIQRIVYKDKQLSDGTTKVIKTRELQFPDFYDYDYYFFQAMQEAEEQGKHLCALKSRRKGYSYKNAAMACRNYYLIPGSKTYIYASNKQYLTEDGILTKAWDYMDFIDKNTAWGKKRSVNTQMRKRSGFFTKDEYGNEVEMGYKSEIIGVTLKDNPDIVRGKAGKLIIFEEAGSFTELAAAWQIARPSVEQDGIAFGTMVAFGTGGDRDSHFATLKDMFYRPKGYNCLEFDNIWDEGVNTEKCGFFIPQYTNLDIRDENGKRIYMDEDGNTLKAKALKFILDERKEVIEHATNATAVDRYCAERCLDKDTWISTEDGVMRIKDNPKAWISGVKDIYKVTTEDGTQLYCTDNHKIFNGFEYKELKDYNIGDTIKYYNTEFGEQYQKIKLPGLIPATEFELTIDEDWAKFLGFFMGDGYYYGPSGKIGIVFDKKDKASLQWCKQFMDKNFGKTNQQVIGKLNGGINLSVSRKGSIEIFKALDLVEPNSSGSLKRKVHVPYYIMKSPKSVVSAFLSGLFDSDGYSSKDGKRVGFFSKEKQVLLDMQFLLRGFDIHSSVNTRVAVNGNGYTYNENKLNIRICDIPKFRDNIGFISDRKNKNIANTYPSRNLRDYSYGKIVSIEYVKTEEVWDINTTTHYLSANGIHVHNCVTPQEACLEFGGNIFPKKELQNQLSNIRTNTALRNCKQVGDLVWNTDGSLKWIIKKTGDITKYRLDKNEDTSGSIVIWEHPNKEATQGLYIAGIDSYDYDQSGTNSLGSCFIYKRFQSFEENSDVIVAEYTGRPNSAEEFYENVRKLLIYYNARAMYENQNKGLFVYFTNKHCDYLLADQPDIINDIIGNSKVQRKKGCHMNQQLKQWGEGLIKDWLNELDASGKKNLNKILSEPLLEELISYNDIGNFDRCLTKGTFITTNKGDVPIEDISVNDLVLTGKGNYKPVTWTDSHVHNGNIVTLKISGDYQELICTDNHPILIKYTDKLKHKFRKLEYLTEEFLRADQLNYKYQFAFLPKRKIKNAPRTINDRMLYVLGWIMGDGYCNPHSNEVKITYQLDQLQCAQQCKDIIEEFDTSVTCKLVKDKNANCYRLTVFSKRLHKLSVDFGCIPNNKKLNYQVYNNHTDLMPFILGLLEADGHQNYNVKYDGYSRNSIEMVSIYEELIRQCRQILLDNGIYSTIRQLTPKHGKRQVSLQISGKYVKRLLNYYAYNEINQHYPIFSYKFKQIECKDVKNVALEDNNGFWVPIKLLSNKNTNETVYNIEVQDDHTYVANSITTHNCMALIQLMIYRQQLFNVVVKEKKQANRNRMLFDGPIFADSWYRDDDTDQDEDVYTFT